MARTTEKLYELIPSQQVMYTLVRYSIHKQVTQIPSSITVKEKLDFDLLTKALNIEFERNDALRLRFRRSKIGLGIKQYFMKSYSVDSVPTYNFKTKEEQEAVLNKDAQTPIRIFKDESFRIIFYTTYDGKTGIYFNVSHMVSDPMGMAVFFHDLLCVYKALRDGTELPAPPASYEEHILKEFEYLKNEKLHGRDRDFYIHYWRDNGEPFYAGINGPALLDKAREKNPNIRVPEAYDPIHDEAAVIHKRVSKEDTEKIYDFCKKQLVSPEILYMYAYRAHASKVNRRADDILNLVMCSRRASVKDKSVGGCLAQPLQLRTVTAETETFSEAVRKLASNRNELIRHMNFPYLEALGLQQKEFGFKVTQGPSCFMFSWLPLGLAADKAPFEFEFTAYCMGRYVMPLYIIVVPTSDGGADFYYMYRTNAINSTHIDLLHENAMKAIDMGTENPELTVGELLDNLKDFD